MFDLTGRTALVTGANRGLGRGIAVGLARAGADIIGSSANMETYGSAVAGEVEAAGRAFTGIPCDLPTCGRVRDAGTLAARVTVSTSSNNAIPSRPAAVHEMPTDHGPDVNLGAPFILTRELGRLMVERRQGKIIFIASLLSFQGGITVPGYAASKSGVAALTKAFANEWAGSHVNVNAIAPGYMATDNTQALRDDQMRSNAILERIPAGRWGRPEDLAGAAVFLASAASDYIHGTVITVDGGWMAR
jgi:2-deoxy-D-gluconate 3-dehydrogenase